ncbi:hypothetical protein CRUP_024362 [Coryphaenoides rupestris]|nr:hypothetical protein CRUP_024362 [Coryphaenoides rupestris]
MSKSTTLKIKRLFKPKSLDKENGFAAEQQRQQQQCVRSQSLRDVAPRGDPGDGDGDGSPPSPGPGPGPVPVPGARGLDDSEQQPVGSPVTSPKEKKSKKLHLPFKLKRKKSKRAESSDLFFQDTDELDTQSQLNFDQMSVTTDCSYRTESDWGLNTDSKSVMSFNMTQPHSPTSPSKHYKVRIRLHPKTV